MIVQVFVYNEEVVANSIRPSLVDLFMDVAKKINDKVNAIFWLFYLFLKSLYK